MKILLLGKSGMLAQCFLKHFAGGSDLQFYAFSKDELDITDFKNLRSVFSKISPDFIINCAAYTKVDNCETEKENAFLINGFAVGEIAKLCKEFDSILIHFSTDYVFNGENETGYFEDESPAPLNIYGESKLKGEELIQKNTDNFYIIRTSWLYGEGGKNFVNTMLNLSKTKDELNIVNDQIGSPTYTKDICLRVIENLLFPFIKDVPQFHEKFLKQKINNNLEKKEFGIYHLTNSGFCSWYEFAKEIFKIKNIDIKLNPISTEEYPLPAKRPYFSMLKNTKLPLLRSWQEALKSYLI